MKYFPELDKAGLMSTMLLDVMIKKHGFFFSDVRTVLLCEKSYSAAEGFRNRNQVPRRSRQEQ